MTTWRWPADLVPNAQTWRTISRAQVSPSPLSAYSQAVSRTGPMLACDMVFNVLDDDRRSRLDSFLQLVADQADTFFLGDFAGPRSASTLDTDNVIDNGQMLTTDDWTVSNAVAYTADAGWLMVRQTATGGYVYQSQILAAGTYCIGWSVKQAGGNNGTGLNLRIGSTLGGSEYDKLEDHGDGAHTLTFTVTGGTVYFYFESEGTGSEVVFWLGNIVCTPTFSIANATVAASGRLIRVEDMAAHVSAGVTALAAGEPVGLHTATTDDDYGVELKRLNTDLVACMGSSPANDDGYMTFDPPLRGSQVAGAAVTTGILAEAKMRLASPGYERSDLPGVRSAITLTCIEAFD